ncbi:MAG: molybdenum cofactor biosynthesis protein B [Methanohalobium sp.]|uniref:MogA/MoaB family molybdenum cofactor biosynthesis protein n=1 Tax=Methanohalobium sp. TaxID=2837493 RepID=UPI00397D430C
MNTKSTSTQNHKSGTEKPCKFFLITISSSRYKTYKDVSNPEQADDSSGQTIKNLLTTNGHDVTQYMLINDDSNTIQNALRSAVESDADIIITTGGTGLTSHDVTVESVTPMFDKIIPGFGELFRFKSIEEIGTAVMLTRATAGVTGGKAVFCLPGSRNAVRLAIEDIIIPEAVHIVKHTKD